jgi:hypothetical protein
MQAAAPTFANRAIGGAAGAPFSRGPLAKGGPTHAAMRQSGAASKTALLPVIDNSRANPAGRGDTIAA